jgi:hypothetical protein
MLAAMKILYRLFFLLCFAVQHGYSQDNYEIQVYGAPTMEKGQTMFELHSNFTLQGEQNTIKGVRPSYHALHETLEITHGFTENFELGFYLFTNYTSPYGYKIIGSHLRPRIAAPDKWKLPVGLSLSAEFGYQNMEYSPETWSLEIRPIIDKTMGKLYISLNPVLGVQLKGVDKQSAPDFSPNVKASYAFTKKWSLGTEYYGNLGSLNHFEPGPSQSHALFAVADLYLHPDWEINLGPGWGLNKATDGLVIKLLVGRRIHWKKEKPAVPATATQ